MKQGKQKEQMQPGIAPATKAHRQLPGYGLAVRNELVERLRKVNAFWSYAHADAMCISHEVLIEKKFVRLDIPDIPLIFNLFQKPYVKTVWKEQMAVQGNCLFDLNVMIAMLYFGIKQPEKYLGRIEREHIKRDIWHKSE